MNFKKFAVLKLVLNARRKHAGEKITALSHFHG